MVHRFFAYTIAMQEDHTFERAPTYPSSDIQFCVVKLVKVERMGSVGVHGQWGKRGVFRCEKMDRTLYFEVELYSMDFEFTEDCERLRKHGSMIVETATAMLLQPSEWQASIVNTALRQLRSIEGKSEKEMMAQGYNRELADAILNYLNKLFPNFVQFSELKRVVRPNSTDDELFTSLDALLKDRFINGKALRSMGKIAMLADIEISDLGRSRLHAKTESTELPSGYIVHGDQINNYGQAGAIGRQSHGQINFQGGWSEQQLHSLADELEQLRSEYRKLATSREDDRQLALLADAADEAEKGNGHGVAAALSKVGKKALEIAQSIGTDIAAKALVEMAKSS